MESVVTESGKFLVTQGILGVVVLILGIAVYALYRENQKHADRRFEELHKIIDARENLSKALNMNSLALEANNRAVEQRTRATEEIAREVKDLRAEIQASVVKYNYESLSDREKMAEILRRTEPPQATRRKNP